ncbi:hypothetical protein ENHYD8BJ_140047 [Enhydrobacter sp. 8BJ]|nr:hypothetical protein ENHYD8BJ_140047 [Enhydrobacter sp. 8BJ]
MVSTFVEFLIDSDEFYSPSKQPMVNIYFPRIFYFFKSEPFYCIKLLYQV